MLVSTPSGRANDGFNVFLSDGDGGFETAVRYQAAKQTFDLAVHDADRDGDVDVLTVANDSSVVTVHLNLGDGSFFVPERNDAGVLTRDMVRATSIATATSISSPAATTTCGSSATAATRRFRRPCTSTRRSRRATSCWPT